jgi:hypothetical protein
LTVKEANDRRVYIAEPSGNNRTASCSGDRAVCSSSGIAITNATEAEVNPGTARSSISTFLVAKAAKNKIKV